MLNSRAKKITELVKHNSVQVEAQSAAQTVEITEVPPTQ